MNRTRVLAFFLAAPMLELREEMIAEGGNWYPASE
jgi:hypothetical protein